MSAHKKFVLFLIIFLRTVVFIPFLIFHPFVAYVIGVLLDMMDGPIYKHYLKVKPVPAQKLDKLLDLWLYTVALLAAFFYYHRFFLPVLIGLYLYRLIGQILFLVFEKRVFLTIFINYFEVFYLIFYFVDFLGKSEFLRTIEPQFFYLFLLAIVGVKFHHEVSLHVYGWTLFDRFTLPLIRKAKEVIPGKILTVLEGLNYTGFEDGKANSSGEDGTTQD